MNKNIQLLLFFSFLLCIYLSYNNKEGFVVIDKSGFDAQCNVGQEGHDCVVTQSGASGFICGENPDSRNYHIIGGADGGSIFSDPFPLSLDSTPCNPDNADPDPNVMPSISECTTSNSPYELSGCISKCTKPVTSEIYNIASAPNKIENTLEPTLTPDITCNDGFVDAANICFHKETGEINPNKNADQCTGEGDIWYGDAVGVQTYCPVPGTTYVMMGCEPQCLSRISHSDDYLMGSVLDNIDVYRTGKELMQVTPERDESSIGVIRIINTSPYNVNENGSSLDPNNFSVNINPVGAAAIGFDDTIDFEGEGVSEACNINSDDEVTRDKYYVKGLFPTCGDDEECLNFNITYNEGEDKPYNLVQLRDFLPTDIFQGDPSEDDIQKYRDSLYYFRGFMGSDGRYNVEGQIRCNIDSTSRYGCAILNEIPDEYTWVLGDDTANCNNVCAAEGGVCGGDGDWGVGPTPADFTSLLAGARGGSDINCSSFFDNGDQMPGRPGISLVDGNNYSCFIPPRGSNSICDQTGAGRGWMRDSRRLCRCTDVTATGDTTVDPPAPAPAAPAPAAPAPPAPVVTRGWEVVRGGEDGNQLQGRCRPYTQVATDFPNLYGSSCRQECENDDQCRGYSFDDDDNQNCRLFHETPTGLDIRYTSEVCYRRLV